MAIFFVLVNLLAQIILIANSLVQSGKFFPLWSNPITCTNWRINNKITQQILKLSQSLFSTEEEYPLSIRDEIIAVLGRFLSLENSVLLEKGLNSIDYSELVESSYFLCKGRVYESIMDEFLQATVTSKEIRKIELVDSILRGFIVAERKSRSRQKMNYILAGASSSRFEESIQTLVESDELDDELLLYIDSLIKKETMRALGPMGVSLSISSMEASSNGEEDDREQLKLIQGIGKQTLDVLKMIQRRLKAQIAMKEREEVQLLAALLQENDSNVRQSLLRSRLNKVESLQKFASFVEAGIAHINNNSNINNNSSNEKIELSAGSSERMKDILYDVNGMIQGLDTGLLDLTYSTQADDYLQNIPPPSS